MSRNVTCRFDAGLVDEIGAVADILGVSVSEFIRRAARHELEAVRHREDFGQLVEAERERQVRKFALVDALADQVGESK